VYDALGDVELEQKNSPLALAYYRKAFALYEGLHKREPRNAEDRWYLAHSYYKMGAAKHLIGDPGDAGADFAKSLDLREGLVKQDPKNVQFRAELMLAQARLGRHKEASSTCAELRQRASKNPSVLLTAASGYALCAAAVAADKTSVSPEEHAMHRTYSDLAVDVVKEAASLGFRDVVRLQTDCDLSPLRSYPEYIRLLDQLRKMLS
jgi:hypothetical protein